ncbi:MAG: hydrogenase maturation nickel metallochaperone HypA [Candidatus Omnitrophica bacterium]|nr:hydrogenase maturation nickel metallochaperone HypA [Candidatus Omnitrophota bacterium]
MHDLRYATDILNAIRKKVSEKGSAGMITVNVRLSPFNHVKAEGLKETFRMLAEGEWGDKVRLKIETSEFTICCKNCGRDSKHAEPVFECPHCKSHGFDIEKGREFYIERIEIK